MSTLFVNHLTTIDFSYLHNQRGLLGDSLSLNVQLTGSLDDQGMVLDFADVKRDIKELVDLHFDHKLIVPARSSQLKIDTYDNRTELKFRWSDERQLKHVSPNEAVCLLDTTDVTPESISAAITSMLHESLPDNVTEVSITLNEEVIDESSYQYSHGLKHHTGNCQRIAHGHRSRIIIYRDGTRAIDLEQEWADRWDDIYIGSLEDLVDASDDCHHYAYSSSQGNFELTLPAVCCDVIKSDSTVEHIAVHIAEQLKSSHPQSSFAVHAFEGMNKGAIETR